jgi:hypothetical protein
MANYFVWVGGSTGTTGSYTNPLGNNNPSATGPYNLNWVLAFDWNNPNNWKMNGATYGNALPKWVNAPRCPSIGDIAVFGESNTLAQAGFTLPQAKAPCLWGGASAGITSGYVVWRAGSAGGATLTSGTYGSDLSLLKIDYNGLAKPNSQYPFGYIGTGLISGSGTGPGGFIDTSGVVDASNNGFTLGTYWSSYSWYSLGSILVNQATTNKQFLSGLKLRVALVQTGIAERNIGSNTYYVDTPGSTSPSVSNQGVVAIEALKNLEYIAGACGGSTGSLSVVKTRADLSGGARYRLSGYWKEISRFGNSTPESMVSLSSYPRTQLELVGATVGAVYAYSEAVRDASLGALRYSGYVGTYQFDLTSNVSKAIINAPNSGFYLAFENTWKRSDVERDLGFSGGSADTSPSITVNTEPYNPISSHTPYLPYCGVILGTWAPGGTGSNVVTANKIVVSSSAPQGMSLGFRGNANINNVEATNTRIFAPSAISMAPGNQVNIGQLDMTKSILDFKVRSSFDGWRFGLRDGYNINGGIICRDEQSSIIGSAGVRLYNEQIVTRTNAGVRLGASDLDSKVVPIDLA